jgi:hypothetical protein
MISIFKNIGLVTQFTINEYTLSVYIGRGSHSASKFWEDVDEVESSDAEIAILNAEGKYLLPKSVEGYQSAEAIARVLHVMLTKYDTDEALVQNVLAVLD